MATKLADVPADCGKQPICGCIDFCRGEAFGTGVRSGALTLTLTYKSFDSLAPSESEGLLVMSGLGSHALDGMTADQQVALGIQIVKVVYS